jgi:hypothetical protein
MFIFVKINYLELLRALEGTLNIWSLLHVQPLASTNPHWARVVGYGPLFMCNPQGRPVGLSSWDINKLVMMIMN